MFGIYLTPSGRIGRRAFLVHLVATVPLVLALGAGGFALAATGLSRDWIFDYGVVAVLAMLWINFCTHARRLHDLGGSAWLYVLALFLPGMGHLALLAACGLLKGASGPNRHGAPPEGQSKPVQAAPRWLPAPPAQPPVPATPPGRRPAALSPSSPAFTGRKPDFGQRNR